MNNRPAIRGTDKVKFSIPTPKELNINELHLINPLFLFNSFGVGRQFKRPPVPRNAGRLFTFNPFRISGKSLFTNSLILLITKLFAETTKGVFLITKPFAETTKGVFLTTKPFAETTKGVVLTTKPFAETTKGVVLTTKLFAETTKEVDLTR